MQTHNLIQGSDEWHAFRADHWPASEAPVIMGSHPNMSRDELLEARFTKTPKEFSSYVVEVIFEQGHETEAAARAILEDELGEELYPTTGSNGKYSASFDGNTILGDIGFEHKQLQAALFEATERGDLPPYIYWQLEHQLLVNEDMSGIWFVVSDGTTSKRAKLFYTAVPGRREELIRGWDQFAQDLEVFVPEERTVKPEGATLESMPVLLASVEGKLTIGGNIELFRDKAMELISNIPTTLKTDKDFATAENTVKWFKESEQKIDQVKENLTDQTITLAEAFRILDEVKKASRDKRLVLDKLVDAEKKNRKQEIVVRGEQEVKAARQAKSKKYNGLIDVDIQYPDFWDVVKGKRSIDKMKSAVNDAVAKFKIELGEVVDRVDANLTELDEHAEHKFLFDSHLQRLSHMEPDHLRAHIKNTIRDYQDQIEEQKREKQDELRGIINDMRGMVSSTPGPEVHSAAIEQRITRITNDIAQIDFGDLSAEAEEVKKDALDKLRGWRDAAIHREELAKKPSGKAESSAPAASSSSGSATGETLGTHTTEDGSQVNDSAWSDAIQYDGPIPRTLDELERDEPMPGVDDLDGVEFNHFGVDEELLVEAVNMVLLGSILDEHGNRNDDGMISAIKFNIKITPEILRGWVSTLTEALDQENEA